MKIEFYVDEFTRYLTLYLFQSKDEFDGACEFLESFVFGFEKFKI